MYLLGSFVAQQFTKGAEQDDLDFFAFPEIDSTIGTDAIEAPIDGYMMSAKPKNEAGAKKLLEYISAARGRSCIALKADPSVIATNSKADTSGYTALQKKSAEFVKSAKSIAQFMDRDTRPDFASTVMIPAHPELHQEPEGHRRPAHEHRGPEEEHLRRCPDRRARADHAASKSKRDVQGDRPARRRATRSSSASWSSCRRSSSCGSSGSRRSARSCCPSPTGTGSAPLSGIKSVGLQNYHDIVDDLPAVLAGDPAQPDLAGRAVPRRDAARHASSPCCSTGGCAGTPVLPDEHLPAGGAVARPGRLHLAADLLARPGPAQRDHRAARPTGTATRASTSGPSWSPRAGGTPATSCCSTWPGSRASTRRCARRPRSTAPARRQTFFRVVFPVMRPINIIVLVVTFIESLRAFDIVWVINKGRNGLELISALVTQNVVGEASRIGFGSALATIMLLISQRARRHLPAHRHEGGRPMTDLDRRTPCRRAAGAAEAARGRRRVRPALVAAGLPHRRLADLALPAAARRCSTRFRDYAYTAKNGYVSFGGFTLDNYTNAWAAGRLRPALPQLGDHHGAGGAPHAVPLVAASPSSSRGSRSSSTSPCSASSLAANLLPPQALLIPVYRMFRAIAGAARGSATPARCSTATGA